MNKLKYNKKYTRRKSSLPHKKIKSRRNKKRTTYVKKSSLIDLTKPRPPPPMTYNTLGNKYRQLLLDYNRRPYTYIPERIQPSSLIVNRLGKPYLIPEDKYFSPLTMPSTTKKNPTNIIKIISPSGAEKTFNNVASYREIMNLGGTPPPIEIKATSTLIKPVARRASSSQSFFKK